jgi:hypothetical protein
VGWGVSSMALFTGQHQQLRIGSEHFTHGVLKFTTRIDLLLDFLYPFFGDALGVPFSIGHEDQGPSLMAFTLGTVASGLATTGVVGDQGTRKEVIGDGELAEELEFPLTQARGKGAFGFNLHLVYTFTQERRKYKISLRMRK